MGWKAGALLSVLAGVSLFGGEEPPKPDFGRTGELFAQAVHTESTEYAQARDALEEMGKGVLPFLNNPTELGKSGEESEDPQRRLLAVDFLREIGDAVALPALKEAAATDKDAQVREAAEAAVRKMEGP